MCGSTEAACDSLQAIVREVGYDPSKFRATVNLQEYGSNRPLMLFATTGVTNDAGITRAFADGIAKRKGLRTTSKKGGLQEISFFHQFQPGQVDFPASEVGHAAERIESALAEFTGLLRALPHILVAPAPHVCTCPK